MAGMIIPRLRVVLFLATLLAGGALGVAILAESWLGLVPCALCLAERWPYRIALDLGLLSLLLPRVAARWVLVLFTLAMLAGAGIAAVHVGVENKWWPSPMPECMAPDMSGLSIQQRLAKMPEKPSKACEDPSYIIPAIPVSIALMNLLYALAIFGWLTHFLWTTRRSEP